MSQQANRYRPHTRASIRTAITAREMQREVYRYTRKGA